MNEKNIVVLTGSPRKNGNSDMMADAFIKGAKLAGHTVTKYESAFTKHSGCRACDTCWSKGVPCTFNDPFNEKFAQLLEISDTLVLCTPLYCYGMSSSLQATLEKTYAYFTPQAPRRMKISEMALLLCGADEDKKLYSGVIETYKHMSERFNWSDKGMVVATGFMEKCSISGTEHIKRAEELGKNI